MRGWIEQRHGPTIDLSSAGLIEVLDAPAAAAGAAPPPESSRRMTPQERQDAQPGRTKPPGLVETGR